MSMRHEHYKLRRRNWRTYVVQFLQSATKRSNPLVEMRCYPHWFLTRVTSRTTLRRSCMNSHSREAFVLRRSNYDIESAQLDFVRSSSRFSSLSDSKTSCL